MSATERTAHGWTCLHALALAVSRREYDRGANLIGRIESMELEASLPSFVTIPACALAARVQLELDLPEAALERLATLDPRLVHAAVALAEDDGAESERLVRSAIEKGAGRGFYQTYADEAPLLSSVYRNLARSGDENESARRLAARICPGEVPPAREGDPGLRAPAPAGAMDDLVEPLSPREIEILACVSKGLSNDETGEKLFIAAGTVKWHMANIFGKLGVGNRTRAAAVARELGLIG